MTTAQVFSNGQQLGSPVPPTPYVAALSATFDFSTTIDVAGSLPIVLSLAKAAGMTVVSIPAVGGLAIAPLLSWSTAAAFPALYRPAQNTTFIVPVVVDGAFSTARLTVTAGGFLTFALSSAATPGLFSSTDDTSVMMP